MARVDFIARADDLGNCESTNIAIDSVTRAGFIKNVSVMAPGPAVSHAAELFSNRKDVCFGMHTTLNAEWDNLKWKPILSHDKNCGFIDENGFFLASPAMFAETKPRVEVVMKEVDAQLERLHAFGFDIKYIDSHMLPEIFIEGLDESMEEFARKKGLLDHMYYYALPPGIKQLQEDPSRFIQFFLTLPGGQYFIVAHPSLDTEEVRRMGNDNEDGENVAKSRAAETKIFSNKTLRRSLRLIGCSGVRYDEAKPLPKRLTIDEGKAMLAQHSDEGGQ
jgi:hypothetical protein